MSHAASCALSHVVYCALSQFAAITAGALDQHAEASDVLGLSCWVVILTGNPIQLEVLVHSSTGPTHCIHLEPLGMQGRRSAMYSKNGQKTCTVAQQHANDAYQKLKRCSPVGLPGMGL
eukprot:GHUV01057783.1.p2 GENE.GHUV01057783.1~~GHUV01057783.1.p2  ORF type:complete len:119 (+),score=24.45 GHUV01057783.1:82-438(+)